MCLLGLQHPGSPAEPKGGGSSAFPEGDTGLHLQGELAAQEETEPQCEPAALEPGSESILPGEAAHCTQTR